MKPHLLLPVFIGTAAAQIPAFPGAMGFGAHATGGRGGDVYYVTNLNGSGAGSLRAGIETAPSSGRTIVFAVSGYIPVPGGNLRLVQNKITIAGQTAPGDGIGLRNGTVRITGNNAILRHLRIRHGKNGSGGDCLNVDSSGSDSIVDHVTMQFSTDENISFFSSSLDRFSMQSSISAWGLETHNAGGLWDLNRGTCHGSLWAHHHTRNPKARPSGLLEWTNNVTYDWGIGFIMGDSQTPASWKANVRASYFLSPPGRTDNIALEKATVDRNGNPNFSLYLDNCLHDSNGDGLLNGTNKGYAIVAGSEFQPGDPAGATRYVRAATPFPGSTGNIAPLLDDPLTAYKKVVSSAGALRLDANYSGPLRDEVDTLLFHHVVNQITNRITRESDLPVSNSGFGALNGTTPPTDADLDGMPDFWELALGWNVAVQDHNTAFPSSGGLITGTTFFPAATPAGYTRLEEYLHFKAVPHAVVARNTTSAPSLFTTDLRKFTSGFSKTPVFSLTDVTGGTVAQFAADGITPAAAGPVVKFTPTLNASGRGGFRFTVTDGDGSSWTQQFAILVASTGVPRDLVWIGNGGTNVWDETAALWQSTGGATTAFAQGDTTLFDDRGSATPAVALTGTVSPSAVVITGTKDYTLGGTGTLASTGPLTKAGDTTLHLMRPASFGGGTFLNGGETVIYNGGNLDGGPIRFTGGSTLRSARGSADANTLTLNPNLVVDAGATGNLILSQRVNVKGSLSGGGTFNIFSPSNLGTEGRVYLDGASAGCTGTVNLSGGGTGRIAFRSNGGSFNGFNNARVHFDGINVFTTNNSGGNTYTIGSLSGTANSRFSGAYLGGTGTLDIGGLGLDSAFDGVLANGNTGITQVVKSGTGTLTLGGANTYSGNTSVNAGTLRVTGSLGATAMTVASGAALSGSFTTGGLITLAAGATCAPGNAAGQPGMIDIGAGGIDLAAATMRFDLSSNPAAGNDRIQLTGGTLTLRAPAAAFDFHLRDGFLGAGTYVLIDGPTSATSAPGSPSLTHNLPTTTRQTFSLQRSGGGATANAQVRLVVTGNTGDLTWTGSTSTWDLGTSTPWSGGPGGDHRFFDLDRVRFDDSAANRSVSVAGTVMPRRIDVTHSGGAYTFTGTGTIAGNGSLVKSGTGTLVIQNANSFSGGTTLSAGTLSITQGGALGSGTITISGGTFQLPNAATFVANPMVFSGTSAISSAYSGNSTLVNSTAATFSSSGEATVSLAGLAGILSINGRMDDFSGTLDFGNSSGMLRLNSNSSGASDVNSGSASAHFALGTAGGRLTNRNGNRTIHLGALSGGPSTWLSGRQSGSGATATTYIVGGKNLSTTFSGTISHAGDLSGLHLVKTGSGNWTLSGNSDFTGSLSVESGTLTLTGNTTVSTTATISAGATLDLTGGTLGADAASVEGGLHGHGTIAANLDLSGSYQARGFLTGTPGTLTILGDASIFDSATLRLRAGAASDLIAVTGDLDIDGTLQVQLAPGTGFGRYPLLTYTGARKGAPTLTGIPANTAAHLSTTVPGQIALVIDDSDEDGLPDSWETSSFGGLTQGPADDFDGDGTPNLAEFRLGLDPTSGASAFRASIAGRTLTWPSAPGIVFTVRRSLTLDGGWDVIGSVTGGLAATATFTDPVVLEKAFYRIEFAP